MGDAALRDGASLLDGAVTDTNQTPSYEKAFPQGRVPRLDIVISRENWRALVADMTDLAGEFGGNAMGMPPANGTDGGMVGGPWGEPGREPGGWPGGAMMPDVDGGTFPGPGMGGLGGGGMPPGFDGGDFPGPGMMPGRGDGGAPGIGNMGDDMLARTPTYVECEVSMDGLTLKHVGIRFKGNSSLTRVSEKLCKWESRGGLLNPRRPHEHGTQDPIPIL